MNFYSKQHDEYKSTFKFIHLVFLFNVFPLEVMQKCQHFNFAYYGKTQLKGTNVRIMSGIT